MSYHATKPRSTRRMVTLAAVALVAAAVALLVARPEPGATGAETASRPRARSVAAAPQKRVRARDAVVAGAEAPDRSGPYGLAPGDRLRLRLSATQRLTMSLAAAGLELADAANGSAEIRTDVAGALDVLVYAARQDGLVLGFALRDATATFAAGATSQGLAPPAARDGLPARLAHEALVLVDRSGRISRIVFDPRTDVEARNTWRDLLSRWQVVLPEGGPRPDWTTEEDDTTGTYAAAYRAATTPDGRSISKTKTSYLRVHGGDAAQAAGMTVQGGATFVLEPVPVSVRAHDDVELRVGGKDPVAKSAIDFDLALESLENAPFGRDEIDARSRRLDDGPRASVSALERDAAAGEDVDHGDVQTEIADLETLLAREGRRPHDELQAMQRLVAAITQDETAAAAVVARLGREPCSDELSSDLLGALGAAGTESAQRALAGVFAGESWPVRRRETAIYSLVMVQKPIDEMDAVLVKLHGAGADLAAEAVLMLGAVGDHVRTTDPERFGRICGYLVKSAERAGPDPAARATALDAIGNAGPSVVPQYVRDAARDEDEWVRAVAIRSLQRTPDPAADDLLTAALEHDPSARVRAAAVEVVARRPRDGVAAALRGVLLRDESEEVRRAALSALVELGRDDATTAALRRVAVEDASADLREAARQALAGS